MSTMSPNEVRAWILLSVPDEPSGLKRIIEHADFMNHAIPTHEELHGTLSWLVAADLVTANGGMYALTSSGKALTAGQRQAHRSIHKIWEVTASLLAGIQPPEAPAVATSSKRLSLLEVVKHLSELEESFTIFVKKPWTPQSLAVIQPPPEDESLVPPTLESEGYSYFLEVAAAQEFVNGWRSTTRKLPSVAQECERLIQYAIHDA